MTIVDLCLARVQAFAVTRRWSKTKMAREAGMNDTTLRHFFTKRWNPRANTVRRLEAIIPADYDHRCAA